MAELALLVSNTVKLSNNANKILSAVLMGLPALVLHTTLQAGLPFRRQTVTFVKFPFEVKFGSFLE